MPRVPDFSAQASSSGFSPPAFAAPNVQNAAPQQLQQLGQQVERTGQVAGSVAVDMQQQANHVRINESMNAAVQKKLFYTYDKAQGYLNLKGDAALTRPDKKSLDDEYAEKLQKDLDEISASLGNDAQRQIFNEQSAQLLGQFKGSLQEHVAKEFQSHQISVQDGTINVAYNQIYNGWENPKELAQGIDAIRSAVYEKGRLAGDSGQQVTANTIAALSPAHMIVLTSALAANKTAYANEYFEQNKESLTPEARRRAADALEQGNNEMVAGAAVRELTSSGEWNIADIDKQLVERFKDNPKALEESRRELRYQSGLRDAATEQKEAEVFKPVYDLLGSATQSGRSISRSEMATVLAPLRTTSPEAYSKAAKMLDAHNDEVRAEYEAAQAKARANSERYGAGTSEAQRATWYELKTDPKALKTVNLLSMLNAGAISHKQFTQLVEDQQTLISAKGGQAKEDTLLSDKAAVEGVFMSAYGLTKGEKIDPAKIGKFAEKFDARVRSQSNGKELPQAEKLKIARELVAEVVTEKHWYGDSKAKAFEIDAPPAQKPQAAAPKYGSRSVSVSITPKINPTDRAQIVAYLKSKNLPVNNENIYAIYKVGGGE
jgi:hypothetical protein